MPQIVMLCALIFAQPAEVETRLIAMSDRKHVTSRCGSGIVVPACTRFVGHELDVRCTATLPGAFSIEATPRYTALVYMISGQYMRHEYLHIHDIERSVTSHVQRLESHVFGSRESCERAAAGAAASFAAALQSFAAASNAERH